MIHPRFLVLFIGLLTASLAPAATTKAKVPALSAEYRTYEKGGVFPEIYRDDFTQTLKKYPRGRFARACNGDRVAMQRYFNRALDSSLDGRRSESLGYVLVKIMFRTGDTRFSRALRGGDVATRQAVGRNIDPIIARNRLNFPKTRACYRFRAQADQ